MALSASISSRMSHGATNYLRERKTEERTAAPKLSSHGSKNALYLKTAIKAK